jgi:hypothetical protein
MSNRITISSVGKPLSWLSIPVGICLSAALLSGCGKEPVAASSTDTSVPASDGKAGDKSENTTNGKSKKSSAEKVPAIRKEQIELLVGKWTQQRTGTRNLTIRDDGTATMIVILDSPYNYVFGDKITLNIDWTLKDGRLIFKTNGGKPATQIKVLTKMFGSERDQPILELTSKRLLLKDGDEGEPNHDWTRVTKK